MEHASSLLYLLILSLIATSQCSHNRGGSLQWTVEQNSKTVTFNLLSYWRSEKVETQFTICFGDAFDENGKDTSCTIYNFKDNISVSPYFTTVSGTFTHTFPDYNEQGYFVSYSDCCRLSTFKTGADDPFIVSTLVKLNGDLRQSGSISVPPVVEFYVGKNAQRIPTTLPVNSWSFGSSDTTGLGTLKGDYPSPDFIFGEEGRKPTLTPDPAANNIVNLVWTTTQDDVGQYPIVVVAETDYGTVSIDFIINVVNAPSQLNEPVYTISPVPGDYTSLPVYTVTPGDTVEYHISCSGKNPDAKYTFYTPAVYPGMTLNGESKGYLTGIADKQAVVVRYSSSVTPAQSQSLLSSYTCEDETTTETQVFYTAIYVVVPLVLTPPPTAYTDCRGSCNCLPLFGSATATDGCCGEPAISYVDSANTGSCGATVTRTWFAENTCYQKVNATQIIHVNDNIPPKWTSTVVDRNVQCFSQKDTSINTPTATDNCSKPVTITFKDSFASNSSCKNSVVRTWTAKDTCNNEVTATQKINVNDTILPVIVQAVETIPVLECPSQKSLLSAVFRASDNCGQPVNLTFTDNPSDLKCGTFVRTYVAKDVCGNTATRPFTYTIGNKNKPTITLSNAYSYPQCGRDLLNFPRPTAKSYCGEVLNVTLSNPTLDCAYGDQGTCCRNGYRTWTAVDECGISAVVTETVPIQDTTPPNFCDFPSDTTRDCTIGVNDYSPYKPANTGTPTADDNCGLKSVTHADEVTPGLCKTIITRKWTATDFCGLTANRSQIITIVDNKPPVFTPPNAYYGICPVEIQSVPILDKFSDCTKVAISCKDEILTSSYECSDLTVRRNCSVSDQCKNRLTFSQLIVIKDNVAPEIHVPCDTTVECKTKVDPAKTGNATANDNCGRPVKTSYSDISFGNTHIVRVWVATDACGNTATGNQTIRFNNSKIFLTCPADKDLVCRIGTYPNSTGFAQANDLCTGNLTPEWTDNETVGCPSVIRRTWTVSNDITQRTESCIQVITIGKDKPGPYLKAPRDTTAQCKKDAYPDKTGTACASQICPEDSISTPDWDDAFSGTECDTDFKITRTWKVKDNCGKFSYDTQVIHIQDTEKPTLVVPGTCNVTCRFNATISNCQNATAFDNCDDGYASTVKLSYTDDVTPSEFLCPSKIVRTWRAEDCSGNVETKTQDIIISESPPVFIGSPPECLPDIECEDCFTYEQINAKDSCGKIIPAVASVNKSGTCPMTITITWTATDDCGRTSTFVQKVKVDDKTPPVIDTYEESDIQVECFYLLEVGAVSARDNCFGVEVPQFTDVSDDGNCSCTSCARSITRTWTVKDKCGNPAKPFLQTIVAKKSQGPKLTVPEDKHIRCDDSYLPDLGGAGKAIAYDACGNALYVSHSDKEETFSDGTIVITRTWIAFDDCGANATGTQKIVIDGSKAAGGFTFKVPSKKSLPCDAHIQSSDYDFAGYDDYSKELFLDSACGKMVVENSVVPGCPNSGTVKREWRALRNGVVVDTQYTEYTFADCPAHSAGIESVPQIPTAFYGTAPIKPKITIFDLDLPCEVVTLVWTWGDGCVDTQVCDPNAPSAYCVFSSGNQLVASYPHTYKTSGVFTIKVSLYGKRSGDVADNTYYSTYITVNPWLGNVAGSISFQALTAESSYSSKCKKPWVLTGAVNTDYTKTDVYSALPCAAGIARLQFSASFRQNNDSTYSATGDTIFSMPTCFGGLNFQSTNITHLTLSADKTVAVWTGVGIYSAAPGELSFTVYALDKTSSPAGDKVHFRAKDASGKVIIDTDPCLGEIDYLAPPASEPNFVYYQTTPREAGVTVINPTGKTVSALGNEEGGYGSSVGAGLIAGIVIGLLLFIVLVAGVVYFLLSKSSVAATGKSDQFISM